MRLEAGDIVTFASFDGGEVFTAQVEGKESAEIYTLVGTQEWVDVGVDEIIHVARNSKTIYARGEGEPAPYHDPFADIAAELVIVHDRKGKDYGTGEDPYANVRSAVDFGLPAWIGVLIRMNDKMRRGMAASQQYLETGTVQLEHEGLIDIANDFAVYGIILRIMIEDWIAEGGQDQSKGDL